MITHWGGLVLTTSTPTTYGLRVGLGIGEQDWHGEGAVALHHFWR